MTLYKITARERLAIKSTLIGVSLNIVEAWLHRAYPSNAEPIIEARHKLQDGVPVKFKIGKYSITVEPIEENPDAKTDTE